MDNTTDNNKKQNEDAIDNNKQNKDATNTIKLKLDEPDLPHADEDEVKTEEDVESSSILGAKDSGELEDKIPLDSKDIDTTDTEPKATDTNIEEPESPILSDQGDSSETISIEKSVADDDKEKEEKVGVNADDLSADLKELSTALSEPKSAEKENIDQTQKLKLESESELSKSDKTMNETASKQTIKLRGGEESQFKAESSSSPHKQPLKIKRKSDEDNKKKLAASFTEENNAESSTTPLSQKTGGVEDTKNVIEKMPQKKQGEHGILSLIIALLVLVGLIVFVYLSFATFSFLS